jgi:hypothetical protein
MDRDERPPPRPRVWFDWRNFILAGAASALIGLQALAEMLFPR